MLEKLTRPTNPSIEALLIGLRTDDDDYQLQLRETNREKFVFPVVLKTQDGEFEVNAFTRDLSVEGLGILSPQPFSENTVMEVEVNLHETRATYVAECRWCSKFADSYWTSGWELQNATIDMNSIGNADAAIMGDVRSVERDKFAIPAVIHLEEEATRIQAFSRDVSAEGVNLVTEKRLQPGTHSTLSLVRKNGERYEANAMCIWTKTLGESNWLTGWQFL